MGKKGLPSQESNDKKQTVDKEIIRQGLDESVMKGITSCVGMESPLNRLC